MNDYIVFISDIHLHPQRNDLYVRFKKFLAWALTNAKIVYILGDFFHAWVGDECIGAWEMNIAQDLMQLKQAGVQLYFMPGNRDFLLGQKFAEIAGWQILADPTVLVLNQQHVLLTHGDQFCTDDVAHQWLRYFTRNQWFTRNFLRLPKQWRQAIVARVRKRSQNRQAHALMLSNAVETVFLQAMQSAGAAVLIHG